MPRGPEITLEELAVAIEVYVRTGSYTAAAEAIGRDVSSTRKAILRASLPEKSKLHARAIELGLRNGRKLLTRTNRALGKKIKPTAKTGELVSVAKGLSLTLARLTALSELELKRRDASLHRQKVRAEIDALRKGANLTPEQVLGYLASLPREEIVRLLGMLRREPAPSLPPPPATGE